MRTKIMQTFTLKEEHLNILDNIRYKVISHRIETNKSELVRIGIDLLNALSEEKIIKLIKKEREE